MERKHKITIPEPCHENWDKMTPNENGRFCLSCSKTVVDFTSMLPEEIQHFFIQNQNNKICGRFRKSQLDSVTIQIPNNVLYSQTNYYKMFLLALFIAMGTTLFSCADKEGKKQKIDKIEVVKDKKQNAEQIPPPPAPPLKQDKQDNHEKPVQKTTGEVILENKTNSTNKTKKETIEEPVYNGGVAIETNADFPGGIEQFYNFFEKEFKKPDGSDITKLKIKLSFTIERNGSVTYLQSDPEVDEIIKNEIIRVLKLCPKWEPGTSNGKKITMHYSLPIVLE